MRQRGATGEILHGFTYPLYAVDVVGRSSLVVAGGGGAVKTGVPNRMDVVHLEEADKVLCSKASGSTVSARISGGVETGSEAVMSLAVANSGDGSFITSIEGRQCIEYLARLKQKNMQEENSVCGQTIQCEPLSTGSIVRRRRGRNQNSRFSHDRNSSEDSSKPLTSTIVQKQMNDEWELTKLRSFVLPLPLPSFGEQNTTARGKQHTAGSGLPTCITNGGLGGSWLAVGSDVGSVFLINRHVKPSKQDDMHSNQLKPFLVYPDVSGGLSTGVCSLALSSSPSHPSKTEQHENCLYPLMATVCDQPGWSVLRVWRTDLNQPEGDDCPFADTLTLSDYQVKARKCKNQRTDPCHDLSSDSVSAVDLAVDNAEPHWDDCHVRLHPYATASCSIFSTGATPPPFPTSVSVKGQTSGIAAERANYRFRHCQFMRATFRPCTPVSMSSSCPSETGLFRMDPSACPHYMLVTTVQPLCANRKSVSRLVVWLVPDIRPGDEPSASQNNNVAPLETIQLHNWASVALPPGQLPACLAVLPSRHRCLIGIGTMEGRVDVYFFSPHQRQFSCVYSLSGAHPIFVTALTFLPPHPWTQQATPKSDNKLSTVVDESFELVSVSVDRALRWHSGPSYSRIGRLARGLHDSHNDSRWGRYGLQLATTLACLLVIFLIPIYLALLDAILAWFL
ncbi:hypothetical protein PHET_04839 [Paragonimus heterotremus]|uniref:Prolactin regulatory element-binding protein n=1 Tax=Paragonimus heterotremus TaxID=100268 RepID=A0A8J4WRR0_9TREM|nr:hypothetical protein PHET_04839 [Paragonimus heterotremus]